VSLFRPPLALPLPSNKIISFQFEYQMRIKKSEEVSSSPLILKLGNIFGWSYYSIFILRLLRFSKKQTSFSRQNVCLNAVFKLIPKHLVYTILNSIGISGPVIEENLTVLEKTRSTSTTCRFSIFI
jgi:hypothetical protein